MILVMTISLSLLLLAFFIVDILQQKNLPETAISNTKLTELNSLLPIIDILTDAQQQQFQDKYSSCHEGYVITNKPFQSTQSYSDAKKIEKYIRQYLAIPTNSVKISLATFQQKDFSYDKCGTTIKFPLNGMVISLLLENGKWLNAEVHKHEWHLREIHHWLFWTLLAFVFIAAVSIKLISHLTKPLTQLNNAAQQFTKGLEFSKVEESGSPDLRQSIKSFNEMQQEAFRIQKDMYIRIKDLEFRFISSNRGKKISSDLDLKIDFNLMSNKTVIRKVIEEIEQLTMGQQVIKINFSADYVVNQRLNLKLFYDKVITNPFISTTFPGAITNAGFSLRFTLAG